MHIKDIEAELKAVFPVEQLHFLPRDIRRSPDGHTCLLFPYVPVWHYHKRLNEIAFGHWQSPTAQVIVAGTKIITLQAVEICGVTQTGHGEEFLVTKRRDGELQDEENAATEAYAQAFTRACHAHGFGAYLRDLGALRVPYDYDKGPLIERLALAIASYERAGLPISQAALGHVHPDDLAQARALVAGRNELRPGNSGHSSKPNGSGQKPHAPTPTGSNGTNTSAGATQELATPAQLGLIRRLTERNDQAALDAINEHRAQPYQRLDEIGKWEASQLIDRLRLQAPATN
jgi:hypothetical protein